MLKLHKEKDSYILHRMKELKFGNLKSAFDIKIYTATSNSPNSIDQSSTPQRLTTTKVNVISETPPSNRHAILFKRWRLDTITFP